MATAVSRGTGGGAGGVGGIFVRFSGDSTNLLREINRSVTSMRAAERAFGASALGIATAATAAFTAVGVAAVREFGKFQTELVRSQAIMGDLSESTKQEMGQVARTLATELPVSAAKAAESFFFLASAGMSAQESIAAVDEVAKFAVAGQFDMATATDLATDAQSALGMTIKNDVVKNTENMVRVTDTLVEANTLANATVRQFSEALTNEAAAAMKAWNIDIEEGVGFLSVYADQGVKGNRAGAALARTIRLLTSAQSNNAEAFKLMNVEIFNAETGYLDLSQAIEQITAAVMKLPPHMRSAALETLGFQAKLQGVLFPLLGNSEAARKYTEVMKELSGTTEDVANRQLESFADQMAITRNRINDLFLSIGESLMPIMLALNNTLKDGGLSMLGLKENGKALAFVFRSVMAPAIGFVGNIVETLTWAFAQLAGGTVLVFQTITSEARKVVVLLQNMSLVLPDQVNKFLKLSDGFQVWIEDMEKAEEKSKSLREAIAQLTPSTRDGQFSNKLLEELDKFEKELKNREAIEVKIEMAKASVPEVKKLFDDINEDAVDRALAAQELSGSKSSAEKARDKAKKETLRQLREEQRIIDRTLGIDQRFARGQSRGIGGGGGQDAFDSINADIGSAKDQLKELEELSELKLELTEEETARRAELERNLNEEILRLERERTVTQLGNAEELFGGLASITQSFAGKQSGIYKAMFATEKAFAIAKSIIKIQSAIATAADSGPFPANLGAIATVIAQTAGIVTTIQSTAMEIKGSKRFGGHIRAGEAHVVGELGREVFVPDSDGTIIPNDRVRGSAAGVSIVVENHGPPVNARVVEETVDDETRLRVILDAVDDRMASNINRGTGKTNMAIQSSFGLQRGKRR